MLKFNTLKRNWKKLETLGELPSLSNHKFFVNGASLYIMGGQRKSSRLYKTTADCYKVHLLTGEVERITPME